MGRGHGKHDQIGGSAFRHPQDQVALSPDLGRQLRKAGYIPPQRGRPSTQISRHSNCRHFASTRPAWSSSTSATVSRELYFRASEKAYDSASCERAEGSLAKENTLGSELLQPVAIRVRTYYKHGQEA